MDDNTTNICREAILHIPQSQFSFAINEHAIVMRLRVARGNILECSLCFGDRAFHGNPVPISTVPMEVVCSDLYYDFYETTLSARFSRICYCFLLKSNSESLYYCADLFLHELPVERNEYYQYPYIRREEISTIPVWFENAVVYNIFPDSFASERCNLIGTDSVHENGTPSKSQSRHGGTLYGIRQNLDYIAELGANCLYLNPIFTAGEYHKYDIVDYYHIDPCFGTDADFKDLVDAAHDRGIAVILDGVFNHCSWFFFAFDDVVKRGRDSEYVDWFYDLSFPVVRPDNETDMPGYACFAYERKMPKLNSSHPDVRAYFMDVCKYWMREYRIDGWRLDVASELDKGFWREFRHVARQENPDCVMIAEIWESAEIWLRGDMFDSTMNYDFRKNCRDFFAKGILNAAEFDARATMMRMRYPYGIMRGQLNLLDSHDVSRFLSLCSGDKRRLRLAILFQMSFPGVPSIFYGDELGVNGLDESDYRKAMPWGYADETLLEFYKSAISIREYPEVVYGDYHTLYTKANMYIFERRYKKHSLVVVLNVDAETVAIPFDPPKNDPVISGGYSGETLCGFGYVAWRNAID